MTSEKNLGANSLAISVVVPVRNEENSVRVLLEGLLCQTLPPDEIVITDGGSTDDTREIIEEFIRNGAPVKLIREEFSMPGRARNVGVRNSGNDWIAFTDAGNRVERDWLATLARRAVDDEGVDVVYGSYEPVIESFFEECAAIAYVPPRFRADGKFVQPRSIVSALMRRSVWEAVGGFPEDLRSAEDLLFMRKVEEAGFRIEREPAAIVHWNIQPSLWRTFIRFVVYARNNIQAGLWRNWQASIFLWYTLIFVLLTTIVFVGWWGFLAAVLFWICLMIARAMKSIYRNRRSHPAGLIRNFARLFMIVLVLAAIDAAAIIGSVVWLFGDQLRLSNSRGPQ